MVGEKLEMPHFSKLTGTNWALWKQCMVQYFKVSDMLKHVQGDVAKPMGCGKEQDTWEKRDGKVTLAILSAIDDNQHIFVAACETAHEMWRKLLSVYERVDYNTKMEANREYHAYRYMGGPMAIHIAKVEELEAKCKRCGDVKSKEDVLIKLMDNLPSESSMVNLAFRFASEEKRTLDELKQLLLSEEARISPTCTVEAMFAQEQNQSQGQHKYKQLAPKQKLKSFCICFKCGERGHFKRDCPKNKKSKMGDICGNMCFSAEEAAMVEDRDDKVLCDCGASSHMYNMKEWFMDFHESQEKKVDNFERAKRVVENPLIQANMREKQLQDQSFWEQQEKELIAKAIEERNNDVATQEILAHMKPDKYIFFEKPLKERNVVYEDKLCEFEDMMSEEKAARLLERKIKRKEDRRKKFMKEKEEEAARKREEQRKLEEEAEMLRLEEERKEKKEKEEEAARKREEQRKLEEEAEMLRLEEERKEKEEKERIAREEREKLEKEKQEEEIERKLQEEAAAKREKTAKEKDAWLSKVAAAAEKQKKAPAPSTNPWRRGGAVFDVGDEVASAPVNRNTDAPKSEGRRGPAPDDEKREGIDYNETYVPVVKYGTDKRTKQTLFHFIREKWKDISSEVNFIPSRMSYELWTLRKSESKKQVGVLKCFLF